MSNLYIDKYYVTSKKRNGKNNYTSYIVNNNNNNSGVVDNFFSISGKTNHILKFSSGYTTAIQGEAFEDYQGNFYIDGNIIISGLTSFYSGDTTNYNTVIVDANGQLHAITGNTTHSFISELHQDTPKSYLDAGVTTRERALIVSPWSDSIWFTPVFGGHNEEYLWIKSHCPDTSGKTPFTYHNITGLNANNEIAAFTVVWRGDSIYLGRNAGIKAYSVDGNVVIAPDGAKNILNGANNTIIGYSAANSIVHSNNNVIIGNAKDIEDDNKDNYLNINDTIKGYKDEHIIVDSKLYVNSALTFNASDAYLKMTMPCEPVQLQTGTTNVLNSFIQVITMNNLKYSNYELPVNRPSNNSIIVVKSDGSAFFTGYTQNNFSISGETNYLPKYDNTYTNLKQSSILEDNETNVYVNNTLTVGNIELLELQTGNTFKQVIADSDGKLYKMPIFTGYTQQQIETYIYHGEDANGLWLMSSGITTGWGANLLINSDFTNNADNWTLENRCATQNGFFQFYNEQIAATICTQGQDLNKIDVTASQDVNVIQGATYQLSISCQLLSQFGSGLTLQIKLGTQTIATLTGSQQIDQANYQYFEFICSVNGIQTLTLHAFGGFLPIFWVRLKQQTISGGSAIRIVDPNNNILYTLPENIPDNEQVIMYKDGAVTWNDIQLPEQQLIEGINSNLFTTGSFCVGGDLEQSPGYNFNVNLGINSPDYFLDKEHLELDLFKYSNFSGKTGVLTLSGSSFVWAEPTLNVTGSNGIVSKFGTTYATLPNSIGNYDIQFCTQAEYDAISPKLNKFYYIIEE